MLLYSSIPTPKDLKFSLRIMEILITKGNLTLIPKQATDEHLNDLLIKKKKIDQTTQWGVVLDSFPMKRHLNDDKQFKFLKEGSNRILSKA